MERLEIKSDDASTAILSMNDATGLLQSLTLDDVVIDGESSTKKGIFPDNGLIYGVIDIKNCLFKDIAANEIIDTVKEAKLYSLNAGYLSSVNFHNNVISGSKGHVAFRGRLDKPIDTVTITQNTMSTYATGAANADSALVVSQAKAVTLTKNTIDGMKAVGTRGMGHGFATWSTHDGWTLTLSKNNIINNAGGMLIATDLHGKSTVAGASTNLGAATFRIPKGSTTYNSFAGNTYFGVAIADVVQDSSLNF